MAITYIDTSSKEIKIEGKKTSSSRFRLFIKTVLLTIVVTLVFFVLIGVVLAVIIYPKAKSVQNKVEATYTQAKILEASLKNKDLLTNNLSLEANQLKFLLQPHTLNNVLSNLKVFSNNNTSLIYQAAILP